MTRNLSILMLCALTAGAQTKTNRCFIDLANRAESESDYVPDALYANTLGGWFCFPAAPTNATTYASGDGSRLRYTLEQPTNSWRPSWSTNGMSFDGTDDRLVSVGAPTGMWYGLRAWVHVTNSITADSDAQIMWSRRSGASAGGLVAFGQSTGRLTNETLVVLPSTADNWRIGITNDIAAGWHHVVVTWQTTNYSVYLDGVRPPHIYSAGTVAAQTNQLEYWIGGYLLATSSMLRATVDCFVLLTNTWTAADISLDFTNGARMRGLIP